MHPLVQIIITDILLSTIIEGDYGIIFYVWQEKQEDFDLQRLHCFDQLKNYTWIENSVGTLGGGNHFRYPEHRRHMVTNKVPSHYLVFR